MTGLEHGDYNAYMRGCRCRDCKAANAARSRRYRQKLYSKRYPRRLDADLLAAAVDHDGFWERVHLENAKRDVATRAAL